MLWVGDIVLVIGIFLLTAYVDLSISMQGKHDMGTSIFLVAGSITLCAGVILIGIRNIQQIQRDSKQEARDIEQANRDARIDALVNAVNTLIGEDERNRRLDEINDALRLIGLKTNAVSQKLGVNALDIKMANSEDIKKETHKQ